MRTNRDVSALLGAPPHTLGNLPNEGGTAASIRSTDSGAATLSPARAENSTNATADVDEAQGKRIMNDSAILVLAMLAVLWILGGIVFKSANL